MRSAGEISSSPSPVNRPQEPFARGDARRGLADEIGHLLHHRRQMCFDSRYEIPDHPFVNERLRLTFVGLSGFAERPWFHRSRRLTFTRHHLPLFRVVPSQGGPFSIGNLLRIGVRVASLEPE
jgi:hypothetical protein